MHFVRFCVSRLVALNFRVRVFSLFYLAHKFLLLAYWNTAILDFQGEIVPIDLPNPEDTQMWVGENELLPSRQHQFYFSASALYYCLYLTKYGLDAMVTVYWRGRKTQNSEMFWTTQVVCWLKQLKTGKLKPFSQTASPDYFSSQLSPCGLVNVESS